MFCVYVLQHKPSSEIYIGFTTDLKRRLSEHNNRGNKFTTRHDGKWKLVYAEAYASEKDAHEREAKLKQHGGSKRLLLKRIRRCLLEPKIGAGRS